MAMTDRTSMGRREKGFRFPKFPSLTNWQLTQWQKAWKGDARDWPGPEDFAALKRPER